MSGPCLTVLAFGRLPPLVEVSRNGFEDILNEGVDQFSRLKYIEDGKSRLRFRFAPAGELARHGSSLARVAVHEHASRAAVYTMSKSHWIFSFGQLFSPWLRHLLGGCLAGIVGFQGWAIRDSPNILARTSYTNLDPRDTTSKNFASYGYHFTTRFLSGVFVLLDPIWYYYFGLLKLVFPRIFAASIGQRWPIQWPQADLWKQG